MRGLKRNPWLIGRGVLLAILVVYGGHARADVFTDQSGSIVVFPKVIADGSRDTIIQISNTSNMPAQAHCFYVNALGFCSNTVSESCRSTSECPVGETCLPTWEETDFDLFLTAQQPTQWRVSTGRVTDLFARACKLSDYKCSCKVDYANGGLICPGFPPGTGSQGSFAIIPVGTAFEGELKCIQTSDDFQTPINQNSLKGEAIIETLESGQISEYNAIGISGLPGLGTNNDLLLNNLEYNACPKSLVLNHYADGAPAAVRDESTTPWASSLDDLTRTEVFTDLTLVPCTEIFEPQVPTRSRALFTIVNEFEQSLSAEVTFDCYLNRNLSDISSQFSYTNVGTQFAKTRISPPSSNICQTGSNIGLPCTSDAQCPGALTTPGGTLLGCRPWTGLLGVAEEFFVLPPRPAGHAAVDLHMEGSRCPATGCPATPPGGDIIVPPEGAK
jgi:hypothetical protein